MRVVHHLILSAAALSMLGFFSARANAVQNDYCLPGLPCATPSNSANPDPNAPGTWTRHSYSGPTGSRDYYVYTPKSLSQANAAPLVVMLHGCQENPEKFAQDTGMNTIAEENGFVVVYPEQTSQDNMQSCWNWFAPENQTRGSGELAIIVGIVQKLESTMNINPGRVYVAGLSAGAALASNLMSCYSDVFAGAAIHSGLMYETAKDVVSAEMAMSNGPSVDAQTSARDALKCTGSGAHIQNVVVLYGTQDSVVNPLNSKSIVEQVVDMNNLLDPHHAQSLTPISSTDGQVQNGYSYTTRTYGGEGVAHVLEVQIHGMNHAWSGSPQAGSWADPKGPNASEMIWKFFSSTL